MDVAPESQSSSKRRQYPTQQYNFNAAPASTGYPDPMGYVGGAQPGPIEQHPNEIPAQQAVFTPAMAAGGAQGAGYPGPAAGPDPLISQFSSMGMGGNASQPSSGGAYFGAAPSTYPSAGYNATPSQPALPLNQIYNLDLFAHWPPPISDLDLPPPPIILSPEASCTQSPDANASPTYIRSTLNVAPTTNNLLKKSKLPFALVVSPYAALHNNDENIPVVDDSEICRCRRCRSYINPFVSFQNQALRWKCNICGLVNDVPQRLFDNNAIWSRKELNYGVVDFVAPAAYMVRAPQPPVYVFLLDVSIQAIQSGLLATAARVIKENLDRLPNKDDRCRVSIIAVDQAIHFFDIAGCEEDGMPPMYVVTDLESPFLPMPTGLLVNLLEYRKQIDKLLDNISEMFSKNINPNSALCSALTVAQQLIAPIGGKLVVLTATLPDVGIAKLEVREDRKVLGTPKENALLQPAHKFYKTFAIECNKTQVSVDMFLFSSRYQDVASLSNLPRFTGGQTYFYPGWSASRPEDAIKLAHELGEHMSMEVTYEAVMRVRCSAALKTTAFYGNFFNRSTDLCAFPSFPRDQSYVVEIGIEENISAPTVAFQVAVLHSTCDGQRRIRVVTLTLPTSPTLQDIYASSDQLAIASYLSHKACERALSSGLDDARQFVNNKLIEILTTYKKELMTTNVGSSAPLQFCANLRMLPLLVNSLLKSVAIRKSGQIASDLRSASICLLSTLPVKYLIKYLHPDLFSLHDMPDEAGYPDESSGDIVLPPKQNLSSELVVSHGLYLIHDGQTMFLWIGRDAVPQLIVDAFGFQSKEHVQYGKVEMPETDSPLNIRIRAIIAKLREKNDNVTWPSLFVVAEDGEPALKLWASSFLVEDRTDQSPSYYQFLTSLRDKVSN